LKEEEIRPESIFDEYLRLAKIDTKVFFDNAPREEITCPACGINGEQSFSKNGFNYELCPDCSTLFVSPRPINDAFVRYYSSAPSTEYWATTFYKATIQKSKQTVQEKIEMLLKKIKYKPLYNIHRQCSSKISNTYKHYCAQSN